MNQPWHAAIAAALTGEELDLGVQPFPDPVALEHQLAAAGWSAARLLEHARATAAREEPWPHAIPEALRPGLGAAQLHAAIGRVLAAVGPHPDLGKPRLWTMGVKDPAVRGLDWPLIAPMQKRRAA